MGISKMLVHGGDGINALDIKSYHSLRLELLGIVSSRASFHSLPSAMITSMGYASTGVCLVLSVAIRCSLSATSIFYSISLQGRFSEVKL